MEADPISHGVVYNQDDIAGFIRLNAPRPASGIAAKIQRKKENPDKHCGRTKI
jgi:hypothetical protein